MRRFSCSLCLLVLLLAGCGGGAQTAAQKTRQDFLFTHPKLNDQKLAALCPSLYPTDFRYPGGPKKYGYTKDKKPYVPTPALRAQATRELGCSEQGTKPTGDKLNATTTPTTTTSTTSTTPTSTTSTTSTTPTTTTPPTTTTSTTPKSKSK